MKESNFATVNRGDKGEKMEKSRKVYNLSVYHCGVLYNYMDCISDTKTGRIFRILSGM